MTINSSFVGFFRFEKMLSFDFNLIPKLWLYSQLPLGNATSCGRVLDKNEHWLDEFFFFFF